MRACVDCRKRRHIRGWLERSDASQRCRRSTSQSTSENVSEHSKYHAQM